MKLNTDHCTWVFDFIVIHSLVIATILNTTFDQDFNNRRKQCVSYTQVQ
jgi:hypothetical protein